MQTSKIERVDTSEIPSEEKNKIESLSKYTVTIIPHHCSLRHKNAKIQDLADQELMIEDIKNIFNQGVRTISLQFDPHEELLCAKSHGYVSTGRCSTALGKTMWIEGGHRNNLYNVMKEHFDVTIGGFALTLFPKGSKPNVVKVKNFL